jgi:small subunit ribosomal protein S2
MTDAIQKTETSLTLPAYDEMIKAGMHFGRKKTVFHPNMQPFVYSQRDNIYILDLIKTAEALEKTSEFLKKAIVEGKLLLFVGLTKQSTEAIKTAAEALKMPYVTERWLGGTLTNFKTIISRVKYLEELEGHKASGEFEKFTKRERVMKEREIEALQKKFNGIRTLTRLPDILFVSSLKESQLPVHEAQLMKIPVAGIVNTDSDPKQISYPIPANDNSKKSVELILETLQNAVQS